MLSLFSILPYKKNSILGLYLPFSWSSPTGNSEFLNHSYTQTVVFGELENWSSYQPERQHKKQGGPFGLHHILLFMHNQLWENVCCRPLCQASEFLIHISSTVFQGERRERALSSFLWTGTWTAANGDRCSEKRDLLPSPNAPENYFNVSHEYSHYSFTGLSRQNRADNHTKKSPIVCEKG